MTEPASETQYTQETSDTKIQTTQRVAGIERVTDSNISYGSSIKINADNIDKIGLSDDIHTYHMDKSGHLETIVEGHLFAYDFDEKNPQDFLEKFGFDDGTDPAQASPSFKIQTVEVDGYLQGYFIYNDTMEDFGDFGLYLDTDALDLTQIDPELKNALLEQKQEEPSGQENTAAPLPNPSM